VNPVRTLPADDERLEPFRAVGDPELVRRRGLFVAEGRRVVAALLAGGRHTVERILLSAAARAALAPALEGLAPDVEVVVVDGPSDLRALAGHRFHQGCLALARLPAPRGIEDLALSRRDEAGVVVALEGVTNPDNVGTIFRSASAFGASAVLLSPGCAHPLYRKALRTSMGTALDLRYAHPEPWPAALEPMRDLGYAVLALTPAPGAVDLEDALGRLPVPARVVLLLGSEERGLEAATLAQANEAVRIPMAPGADSLNVAATAAIALHRVHALVSRSAR
jgi:tRNA G18 (ribose-2'-O)-methylase SpoU